MKRQLFTTIAIALGLSAQGQTLVNDLELSAYSNQTSIQALGSVTVINGFHIPVQPPGRSVTISIAGFQNLVSQPSAGQNYILTKTFRKAGVMMATLNSGRTIDADSCQYVIKLLL